MGANETREVLFSWEPAQGERRTLLRESDGWVWKSDGKISRETPVTVTFGLDLMTKPHGICTLAAEKKYWESYQHFNFDLLTSTSFERIEQPPVAATTKSFFNPFGRCYPNVEQKTADLIWLRAKHPKLTNYAFGVAKYSLQTLTIEQAEISHTPFRYQIWLVSLVETKYPVPSTTRGVYVAERGKRFPVSYQFLAIR
jgi:hypothetical protein